MASCEANTRFASQLLCMNCQTFSAGLSSEAGQGSGHWGSSGTLVMFTGTANRAEICQPAWSTSSTQCVLR